MFVLYKEEMEKNGVEWATNYLAELAKEHLPIRLDALPRGQNYPISEKINLTVNVSYKDTDDEFLVGTHCLLQNKEYAIGFAVRRNRNAYVMTLECLDNASEALQVKVIEVALKNLFKEE